MWKLSESSLISGYSYDENLWELTVEFKQTKERKVYKGFPPDEFGEFEASDSLGRFFNARIARKYDTQKLDPATYAEVVGVAENKTQEQDFSAQLDADIALVDPGYKGNNWASLFPEIAQESKNVVNGFDEDPTYGGIVRDKTPNPTINQTPAFEVLPPEAELPKKNDAFISAMIEEAKLLAAKPIVVTADTYQESYAHIIHMVERRKQWFNLLDPIRAAIHAAYVIAQTRQKAVLDIMDVSIKSRKDAHLTYDQKQERERAEVQRLADEAQRVADEAERKRISDELTHAEIGDALAVGDVEKAEELFANPIEVAPIQTFTPRIESLVPAVSGKSTRKNWKAVVTDREALILDIAAGIEHFKKHGHLGPHAPDTFIEFNETAMNQEAKSKENKMRYPGVHASNNPVMSIRSPK